MNQFFTSFVRIEKSLQILAIVGVLLLLGYVGLERNTGDQTSAPISSPASQQ